MKKYVKIFAAAVVLLCGMIISGCKDLKDAFTAPKDTWFMRQITYANKAGNETTLNVYLCYTENGFVTETNVQIEPGLNVVVVGSTEVNSVINGLTDDKYIIKNFSNSTKTTISNSTDDDASDTKTYSFKMSASKWTWMYNLIDLEPRGKNIAPFNKEHPYTKLDNLQNISWKKIMASYLLDSLLE